MNTVFNWLKSLCMSSVFWFWFCAVLVVLNAMFVAFTFGYSGQVPWMNVGSGLFCGVVAAGHWYLLKLERDRRSGP